MGIAQKRQEEGKRWNIPFDLELTDIVIPDVCPILGIPLKANQGTGQKKVGHKPNSPSLDRLVPALGYVKGNVQVVSIKANQMKQDATPTELITFAKWALRK